MASQNGKKFILYLSVLLLSASASAVVQAQGAIVKWVDENGKVHFGDRPPKAKNIQVETIQRDASEILEEAETQMEEHDTEQVEEPEWDSEAEIERIKREAGIHQSSGDAIETRSECFAAYPASALKRTARGLRQDISESASRDLEECLDNVCSYYDECE